jgi:hypothetical protein
MRPAAIGGKTDGPFGRSFTDLNRRRPRPQTRHDARHNVVPPLAHEQLRHVREAIENARDLREGRPPQTRLKFGDVDDREL